MPISLTCTCGSRLEIDDKFAGQTIPCPDCNKPLLAELPPPAPTRTSGLAVLSLLLALVGAFTVVGTLAAVACGAVAYRQITRKRVGVGGIRIAQAGMILGGAFTVLAVGAYVSRSLLGIDSLSRQYAWAGKLDFGLPLTVSKKRGDDRTYLLDRPSTAWGSFREAGHKQGDHLMLVNVRDDAQILWLSDVLLPEDDEGSLRARARDCLLNSHLLRAIGRLPENASEAAKEHDIDEEQHEFQLDINVGGVQRSFVLRIDSDRDNKGNRVGQYINVLVGGARAHRFAGLRRTFQAAMGSFRKEQ